MGKYLGIDWGRCITIPTDPLANHPWRPAGYHIEDGAYVESDELCQLQADLFGEPMNGIFDEVVSSESMEAFDADANDLENKFLQEDLVPQMFITVTNGVVHAGQVMVLKGAEFPYWYLQYENEYKFECEIPDINEEATVDPGTLKREHHRRLCEIRDNWTLSKKDRGKSYHKRNCGQKPRGKFMDKNKAPLSFGAMKLFSEGIGQKPMSPELFDDKVLFTHVTRYRGLTADQ